MNKSMERELLAAVIQSWTAYKMYLDQREGELRFGERVILPSINEALVNMMNYYDGEE